LHFRNNHDSVINFTNALSKAHKALVIFPESSLDSELASTFFRYVIRKFSSDKVTVLIRDNQLFAMSSAPPLKTLIYSWQDINTWFVPRRKLLQKMKAKSFDVAFDLNIGLSLPGAFLCKASNAPLRISFAKQNGDQFYNFQIKTLETTSKTHYYGSLLKCLEMF